MRRESDGADGASFPQLLAKFIFAMRDFVADFCLSHQRRRHERAWAGRNEVYMYTRRYTRILMLLADVFSLSSPPPASADAAAACADKLTTMGAANEAHIISDSIRFSRRATLLFDEMACLAQCSKKKRFRFAAHAPVRFISR